jgi:hypothetical protein
MSRWRAPARLVRHWRHADDAAHDVEPLASADVLAELQRWVVSLPWVMQMDPIPEEPSVERFAVDCPLLDCRSVWLSIEAGGDGIGSFDIHLVLPRPLARRGVTLGWAAPLVDLDADKVVVGVATPTTSAELQALQALLGVGYGAAFPADDAAA